MKKYEFKKITLDEYKLVIENKEYPFKRTIEMGEKVQGITASARIKMLKELTKMGLTKNDLIIKKDLGNGKTVYDETNYQEFEKKFIEEETLQVANDLMESCFKMTTIKLFEELGINVNSEINEDEANGIMMFTQKFITIISKGEEDTPSDGSPEQL